jgi:hypothetical protein
VAGEFADARHRTFGRNQRTADKVPGREASLQSLVSEHCISVSDRKGLQHSRWAQNNKAARRRLVVWFAKLKCLGAGEGIRTLDPDLGKVVLYH